MIVRAIIVVVKLTGSVGHWTPSGHVNEFLSDFLAFLGYIKSITELVIHISDIIIPALA
jgi:hypothetical protein